MTTRGTRRILAFEPYDGGSHRAVRESIERHSRHSWQWYTRPARAWKWRMRMAAFELIDAARRDGALDEPPDAIFATSLLDAAELRAGLPATHRTVPLVVYFHENQAAYPVQPAAPTRADPAKADWDVQFLFTNLASVLSADLVLWNSTWNRDSFIDGIVSFLRHAPDAALPDVRALIEQRSRIAWPPVESPPPLPERDAPAGRPIRVVWPHRWEYDKGPGELLELAARWTEPLNLRWTILGPTFRTVPPEFAEFEQRFAPHIDHMGFAPDREAYWNHLARCDWVLSTAGHEFFGIAVVEAMLAGCLPWLPERLSYPELLPAVARGLSPERPPDDASAVRDALLAHLRPALAPVAVGAIDDALDTVMP